VSPFNREAVRRFIEQEAEHHRTRTFNAEYRELLRRSGSNLTSVICNQTPLPGLVILWIM
jgi:hypothetical protein